MKISINIYQKTLFVIDDRADSEVYYPISTAKNGIGQLINSEKTPLGKHIIRAKIGSGYPPNTVFVARRPTGEIYSDTLTKLYPDRDWILTRILWLSGTEIGKNRLGKVDTMRRYIYIHGAPDSHAMGVESSHGCVKMRSSDIIDLFERVHIGCHVDIVEK